MWTCRKCGQENPEWISFCKTCKTKNIETSGTQKESESHQPAELARRITQNIHSRHFSDKRLSPLWALLPLLMVAATIGMYIIIAAVDEESSSSGYTIVEHFYVWGRNVMTIVFGLLLGLLIYNMLRRMNSHIDREEKLRADVMAFLRAHMRPDAKEQDIVDDLLKLSAFNGQATAYEKKLNPAMWAWGVAAIFCLVAALQIAVYNVWLSEHDYFRDMGLALLLSIALFAASLIALVGVVFLFYLASHLTRTIYTHEVRWGGFANSTIVVFRRLGIEVVFNDDPKPLKERSAPLFVVLTIVTLGVFGMYWLYTLIADPNRHFDAQHRLEDSLVESLRDKYPQAA